MKIDDNGVYLAWDNLFYGFIQIVMSGLLLVNSLFNPFSVFFLGCIGLAALIFFFPTDSTQLDEKDIKALFYYLTFLFINTLFGAIGYFMGLWQNTLYFAVTNVLGVLNDLSTCTG